MIFCRSEKQKLAGRGRHEDVVVWDEQKAVQAGCVELLQRRLLVRRRLAGDHAGLGQVDMFLVITEITLHYFDVCSYNDSYMFVIGTCPLQESLSQISIS